MEKRQFRRNVNAALGDEHLQTALSRATTIFRFMRELTFRGLAVDELRSRVRAIKEQSIDNLPELVTRFTAEAEAVGAKVFMARDAEAANRYIGELAAEHGVSLAVKSKSMVTEEIGLNAYLRQRGVKAVETDLGEWIVQLAEERPSHMLAPAIHKPREEVAKLLARAIGREVLSDDIPSLVAVARQELRQSFIDAGLGISGANIAIANTGTVVIVSNEGNARLVTTLPPVHVAVIGIEKTVSSLAEATKILEILPPSATGQKISSYVSFISGPSRTADIECSLTIGVHGPKEMHIILLDNGRNRMRDDPVFREALYCIKCAACLNVCPTYQVVGGHVFGRTYVGGIGAVLTAFLNGLDEAANPAELCLGCGACLNVCPAKIDIPRLVLALRERIAETKGLPFLEHVLYDRLLPNSHTLARAHAVGRVVQRPLARQGLIRGVPFSKVAESRSLPALASKSLRSRVGEAAASRQAATKVAFYGGCLIEHVYPEIGEAVIRVLENHGVSVALPKDATCCGAPARHAGDRAAAVAMAKRNIVVLEDGEPDYLIVACPTCGQAFIHDYPRLFAGDPAWESRALKLMAKTVDFTQFVAKITNAGSAKSAVSGDGAGQGEQQTEVARSKITYHDPCHLRQHLGIFEEPRALLKGLSDYEYVEIAGAGTCCGFGGSFSLKFPEASGSILARRLADVEASGADTVVTACPGCVMQLRGGVDKRGMPVQVMHVAEVLAKALDRKP